MVSAAARVAAPLPESYGKGTRGAGGVLPRLAVQARGEDLLLGLHGGVGGGVAVLLVGSAPAPDFIQARGVLVALDMDTAFRTLVLDGSPGEPGAGNAELRLPSSVFEGPGAYAQLAVLDPAAPGGLALSEGLKIPLQR